jgi:ribosomal protein L37AE/L43A
MDEDEIREARPFPCPECGSTKGSKRVGKFRSQCLNCNALLKNEELNLTNQEPQ